MKHNFIKVSASMIVFILVMAICFAGCGKIDDVAADVEKLSDEVAADIEELSDEVAENKEQGKEELSAEIEKLAAELKEKLDNLTGAYATADGKLNDNLSKAIADLKTVCDNAKAALESADAALTSKDTELAGTVDSLKEALEEAEKALTSKDTELAGSVASLKEALEEAEKTLENYNGATNGVVYAWIEMYDIVDSWNEVKHSYGSGTSIDLSSGVSVTIVSNPEDLLVNGSVDDTVVAKLLEAYRVALFRASAAAQVDTIKNEFFSVIDSISSTNITALKELNGILDSINAELNKKSAPDWGDVKDLLDEAYEILSSDTYDLEESGNEAKLIIDGKVVNLSDKFDSCADKFVELKADALEADMGEYVNSLEAVYNDILASTSAMSAIRTDYDTFVGYTDWRSGNAFSAAYSTELADLTSMNTDFAEEESNKTTLAGLLSTAATLTADIDGFASAEPAFSGTPAELVTLNTYRQAVGAVVGADGKHYELSSAVGSSWAESLEALYDEYTGEQDADTKAAIEASVKLNAFNGYIDIFEENHAAAVAAAHEVRKSVTDGIGALSANGRTLKLSDYKALNAARDAVDNWLALDANPSEYDYILYFVTNNTYHTSDLSVVIANAAAEYQSLLAAAKTAWKSAYTDQNVNAITVDNISIYETKLVAVRAWFETYGSDVATADLGEYTAGSAELEAVGTTELEAEIAKLEAALENKIAAAEGEAAAIIADIDNIGTVTTESKQVIEAARARYDKWVSDYSIEDTHAKIVDKADITNYADLTAAEAALKALNEELAAIQTAIAGIKTAYDDNTNGIKKAIESFNGDTPDTSSFDISAFETLVQNVRTNGMTNGHGVAHFLAANSNVDKFTAEEYAILAEAELLIARYNALKNIYTDYQDSVVEVDNKANETELTEKLGTEYTYWKNQIMSGTKDYCAGIVSVVTGAFDGIVAQAQD